MREVKIEGFEHLDRSAGLRLQHEPHLHHGVVGREPKHRLYMKVRSKPKRDSQGHRFAVVLSVGLEDAGMLRHAGVRRSR